MKQKKQLKKKQLVKTNKKIIVWVLIFFILLSIGLSAGLGIKATKKTNQ